MGEGERGYGHGAVMSLWTTLCRVAESGIDLFDWPRTSCRVGLIDDHVGEVTRV